MVMLTFEVEIIDPKAELALREMEEGKQIKLTKLLGNGEQNGRGKKPLQRGSMKGLVVYIADDFDAPLKDFDDYM